MILKFLGTGPNIPILGKRLQSSLLIKYKKINILIDCTPNIKKQFTKTPDYILITHAHKDAAGGLKYMKNTKLLTTKKLYLQLKSRYHVEHLDFVELKTKFCINGLCITPFEVTHSKDFITYGYQITNDQKIVYASDFKAIPTKNKHFFKAADIAIVDGAGWEFPVFDHQSIIEFLKLSKNWNIKKIYFTQIGRRVPEYADKQIKKINKNASLAWDNRTIKVL